MEKENKITPQPIMKIMWGMWSFRTLLTAIELEVFTKIDKGITTSKDIAKELKANGEGIKRLLNACVSLGLLNKSGKRYENKEITTQFLVKGKPTYYGDMILMNGRDSLKDLKEVIINGTSKQGLKKRMEDKEQAKIFTKAMHNNAVGPAIVLSRKFDFSKYKKLLDLGGGSGAYSIILTKNYSNLKSTVFDLPNVCEVAEEYIKKTNSKKVNTFAGDFFKEEFPKGADIVLLSQIIHSFDSDKNKYLLKKIHNYLPQGGLLIINDFLLNEDKTSPLYPTLFALNMLVNSAGGNAYSEEEIKSWIKETGFEYLKTIHLTGPVTSIISKRKSYSKKRRGK